MSNANVYELAMLDLINDERAAAGLEPLRLITRLNEAAENHSAWMLDTDMFAHEGEGGSSPSDRMAEAGYPFEGRSLALENIGWQSLRGAEGIEDDVAQVHAGLMNSPGHRANILSAEAQDIGIGIETGTFTGQGGDFDAVMVTQVFGTTEADISAWVDPGSVSAEDDPIVVEDDPEDDPIVEEPVEDDEPIDDPEEPVEPQDEGDDDEDLPEDDEPVDDEPVDDDLEDDEDMPEDDVTGEDDEDVADDDVTGEDEDTPDDVADDPMEDVVPEEDPVCDLPGDGGPVLPFELSEFTVDLREAFEFTREGDQLVWETSEEKLFEVFMAAFEDWAMIPSEEGEADDTADITDLMVDEVPDTGIDMDAETDVDEWLMECGV